VVDFENTPDETLRELQLVQQYQLQELGWKQKLDKIEIQVTKLEILETLMRRNSQYNLRKTN
jgi:hypothetical protein